MLTKEHSQRVDLLRFPLILMVIFIHNSGANVDFAMYSVGIDIYKTYGQYVIQFVSGGLAKIAVPLFFIFSGFFFFKKFDASFSAYKDKLSVRARSLLFPYLFWNSAFIVIMLIVYALPETLSLASGNEKAIVDYGLADYISAYFGINESGLPIAYQFWFIRDLIILCIASPLIYFAVKKLGLVFISLLFVAWLSKLYIFTENSTMAVLFFSFGAYIRIYNKQLFGFDRYGIAAIIVSTGLLLIAQIFPNHQLISIAVTIGIVSVLFLSKIALASPSLLKLLNYLGLMSFFIFALHEPVLTLVRTLTYKFLAPNSTESIIALYFINPVIVVLICVAVYKIIGMISPRFLFAICGDRVAHEEEEKLAAEE